MHDLLAGGDRIRIVEDGAAGSTGHGLPGCHEVCAQRPGCQKLHVCIYFSLILKQKTKNKKKPKLVMKAFSNFFS